MKYDLTITTQFNGPGEVIKCCCPDEDCLNECVQVIMGSFSSVMQQYAALLQKQGKKCPYPCTTTTVTYSFLVIDENGNIHTNILEIFPTTPMDMLPIVKQAVNDLKSHKAFKKVMRP